MSYAVTDGNGDGKFAVNASAGSITVAGALDHETAPSHTLTVEASDGNDGMATTTVMIIVADVAEDTPSAPKGLAATSTAASITLTWEAPDDSTLTGYQILRKKLGEADLQVHVADTGSTVMSYTDTNDVEQSTTYIYRVKAINAVGIGPWSNDVQITTGSSP